MAQMVRQPRILNKFYVYDRNVGTELGGLVVQHDKDDKGENKPDTAHVLAVVQQVQWWIDQGLMGDKPVGEISEGHKKMLPQVTRGRSEDNDKSPKRVARLDKSVQSGAPVFAGQPASAARFKARQAALRKRNSDNSLKQKGTTSNPDAPQAQAKPSGSPADPRHPAVPPTTPPRSSTPRT